MSLLVKFRIEELRWDDSHWRAGTVMAAAVMAAVVMAAVVMAATVKAATVRGGQSSARLRSHLAPSIQKAIIMCANRRLMHECEGILRCLFLFRS